MSGSPLTHFVSSSFASYFVFRSRSFFAGTLVAAAIQVVRIYQGAQALHDGN